MGLVWVRMALFHLGLILSTMPFAAPREGSWSGGIPSKRKMHEGINR